jgi:hypothetical protein
MKSIIYIPFLMLLISFTTPLKSQTYCASKGVFPWEQWIARVSLAPANVGNNSIKEGYGNFTALTGFTVKRGQNNLFTIDPRASWNNDPRNATIFWRVWIDYNGDGDFTDVGEQVISRQVVFTQGIFLDNETTFIVPTTARLGNTRLRVAMKVGGYPEPCETFDRGEVEDYTVAITEDATTVGRDTLRLLGVTGANMVRQSGQITLNVTLKNTGTAASSPTTPLSIYQNQQPFIFRGPPPTYLTIVADRTPINRALQPNETATIPITFTVFPNFSHTTRPDYSGVDYNGTYIVLGNRSNDVVFNLYFNPILDTLTVPHSITALLENTDLKIDIIAADTTYKNDGKHGFTVKVTNNGQAAAKDVIANVGTATSTFATSIFTSPIVNPQRGTISYAARFGSATYVLWHIGNLAPHESLTASVEFERFNVPTVFPEFIHEVRVGSNQIIDNVAANDVKTQRFVLDATPVYCASKSNAPWELWIAKVQFETINNASEKFKNYANYGYSDYTNLTTTVTRGMTTVLTITPGLSWTGHLPNVYCRAWIDYNGNKTFEPSELIFQNTNVNPFTAAIRVPNALATTTRMRVALKWGGYPDPCETFDRGEVEDYTLNFQTGTAIINSPILTLEAHADLDNAQLMWISNQSDVDYFEIYKADANNVFNKIGVEKGIKNADLNAYLFTDAQNREGGYFYQIKAVKYNGLIQNSEIKFIKLNDLNGIKIFPNPVSDEVSIVLKNYQNIETKVLFYNGLGLVVKTIYLDKINENLIKTEVNDLPNGHYYVRVIANGKRDLIQRFLIVR